MIKMLYRAKRKDNGAWTEGYVFELQPGQYMICDRIQYDRASTLPVWEFFRYCRDGGRGIMILTFILGLIAGVAAGVAVMAMVAMAKDKEE